MATLPVIEDVYRVTWNFTTDQGVTPRIVQHYKSIGSDVAVVGAALVGAVADSMFYPMPASFEPFSMSILPLDGVTPTQEFTIPPTHAMCGGDSQGIPAAAAIMKLTTQVRGPRGRGRSFIGPIAENTQDSGILTQIARNNLLAGWNDFLPAIQALDPVIFMVVASYVHADANPVTNVVFESVLGTQRRRQNQLR